MFENNFGSSIVMLCKLDYHRAISSLNTILTVLIFLPKLRNEKTVAEKPQTKCLLFYSL